MSNLPVIRINDKPGRTITVEGKEYLFFSGFSYLGVTSSEEMQRHLSEGTERYGSVFPSSRIGNVQLDLFEQFEALLSQNTGLPASVSFASGYLAAQAALAYAITRGKLFYTPHAHPSLRVNGLPAPAAEKSNWVPDAVRQINAAPDNTYTVVGDTIDPLLGRVHDFTWLRSVTKEITLLLDDSHGNGILGSGGEGVTGTLSLPENIKYIICYSLAKASGIAGGAISASLETITGIKKMPHFTAATGISPANAYAYMQLQALYRKRRIRLAENIAYLRKKQAIPAVFDNDERLPVFFSKSPKLYSHCLENRLLLSSFSYPGENDPLVTRAVISSLHTKSDLDRLARCAGEVQAANAV